MNFRMWNPVQHALLKLLVEGIETTCAWWVIQAKRSIRLPARDLDYPLHFDFPRDFPTATTVRLVRCYRCTPQIVSLANGVIHAGTHRRAMP